MKATVSIITVNYNGERFLKSFFDSLSKINNLKQLGEIIMVDNGSHDESVSFVKNTFPEVKVLENDINNYARAVNLGIKHSKGQYIALINNDTIVEENWLVGLVEVMESDERIGVVQSKIVFSGNNRINSVGVEEVEDFYFRDIGFDEEDVGQYESVREINFFSGGAVMFRRAVLDDVGDFDKDYLMFYEDIDYSIRCRAKGWKMFYCPRSIVYHKYHGSTSNDLCEYLCSRNRFICLAKHFPSRLANSIVTSHFYLKNQYDILYHVLVQSVKKLIEYHDFEIVKNTLDELKEKLLDTFGYRRAVNFFSQLEVVLDLRKIRIGIYDHAFHFAGGGQRYVAQLAEILQDKYDITYISNKDISLDKYKEWFDIDLSGCKLKIIKIPFYEKNKRYFVDEGMVVNEEKNPFDLISEESLHYDVFLNANMLGKVNPLSTTSVFICHFPDRSRERYFHVDKYEYLVTNSTYTSSWVATRWGLSPTHCIYPPVSMYNNDASFDDKKKIILSVARFEVGGSKKQIEMIKAFTELVKGSPDVNDQWKLILAGGSPPENLYFEEVKKLLSLSPGNIELRPNLNCEELKELYRDSSIFWHACGLGEINPHLVEHFGMTTVEAMQNYCVPIVIDGGGQVEIVDHGINGFRFKTIEELQHYTLMVIEDAALRGKMAGKAYEKSSSFSCEVFDKKVKELFMQIELDLRGVDVL